MSTEVLGFLISAHRQLAQTGVLYMAACGVWGLFMAWRKKPMDANYRGILMIGYILGGAIGLLGLTLLVTLSITTARNPFEVVSDPVHILYGLLTFVSLPMAAQWAQSRGDQRKPLIYALTAFFVMGVMIRGIITANR